MYSGQAKSFQLGTGVYLLVPQLTKWNASLVRAWILPQSVSYPTTSHLCGYAWPTQSAEDISQTLAQITATVSAAGLGTVPPSIWTGIARTTVDTWRWYRSMNPSANSVELNLTGLWGPGEPPAGILTQDNAAAASFSSNLLDAQPPNTETWAVIWYPQNQNAASPSPSPASIYASAALQIRASLVLLQAVLVLHLGCMQTTLT
uniref:Uncharacterized protein n=1 Tax=Eutreptiella gymnastica TaxID=73025 RepID=A0A7S1IGY9_9EUGL